MPNKRKCKYKPCGKFGHDYIVTPKGAYCTFEHAFADARLIQENALREAEKSEKAKHAKQKREFYKNDKSTRTKEAQKAFNAYIRKRDKGQVCISCGNMPNFGAYVGGSGIHAGHYLSCGAHPELRFEPLNCHVQCVNCNMHNSGNAVNYRVGLIKKIGLDKVEWLEGPHEPKKYTCEELKEIELRYKQKLKELGE